MNKTHPNKADKIEPDSPTARQPDSPTARQPDSPTARQPDSPTARQPDSPTARQPDSPTARQPDSPTARQPDSPTREAARGCLSSSNTGGVMTSPARAFLAAGTPGLARLLALGFFLLIGFALPQQAAAQVTPLITITTPENVCEGGTAVFPIALNVAQNEDIEIRHFVASAATHFVAGTSTTFTIPEGETSVEARLVTRVNPSSTDNIVNLNSG